MTAPDTPALPQQLLGRPTIGGLVVPWLTGRTPDGRYRFGSIDAHRHTRAIAHWLCQTCGKNLKDDNKNVSYRMVFAMRDSDIRRLISPEPAMHPVCAQYSAKACPMLAGQMEHYRATSVTAGLAEQGVISSGDPGNARPRATAVPWNLLWAKGYRPITDPITAQPAALILPEHILRVKPIGGAS